MVRRHTFPSVFNSLPVEVFWYPSEHRTSDVILILKGLYGLHTPDIETSWEHGVIKRLNTNSHVVCVNSARADGDTEFRSSKEAFLGKTFTEECDDIAKAYDSLTDEPEFPKNPRLTIIGNSFGGTTLLGTPNLLGRASAVLFIGSGCGKSATTTKPLLSTLPEEGALLSTLSVYQGIFAFVRGSRDSVVPRDSQEKIMNGASRASFVLRYEIRDAEHDLTSSVRSVDRSTIIANIVEHIISLSEPPNTGREWLFDPAPNPL